ncbi:MAG: DUF3761 domain-containing protein [Proteobacteria bacterium]|nr:DUF3761 domain-containing protein [Pseudomonadota bacterium]
MKALIVSSALGLGLLLSAGAWAQPPAGATASCKDGTYYTGTTHKGACRGHKGVDKWLDAGTASAATDTPTDTATAPKKSKKSRKAAAGEAAAPAPAATAAPAAPAAPVAPAAPAPKAATSKRTPPTPASQITAKPGGGPGLVWVNAGSKVYHCQGDEWYGKTKEGSYMSEAAAKAAGNHASHGKACGK